MSTKSSIWYRVKGPSSVHVYVELMEELIYAEFEVARARLVVPVGITRRGLAERIPGFWSCYLGWHLWLLETMSKRGAQKPDGKYEMEGAWSYRCLKCNKLWSVDFEKDPEIARAQKTEQELLRVFATLLLLGILRSLLRRARRRVLRALRDVRR